MNAKEKLAELINKNAELKQIVFKSFDTMKELRKFKEENKKIFTEYFFNLEQIEKLEWELMTPEEQKTELELIEKMKLKREGKL